MKKKLLLSLIIGLFATAQIASGQTVVYCGAEGSATYKMAKDIETYCKSAVTIKPSANLVESFRNLKPGEVCFFQYDILQHELLNELKTGTGNSDNVRLLLPLGNEDIHLICLKTNTIRDFSDLKAGIKVAVGKSGEATRKTVDVVKTLTEGKWTDVELAFRPAVQALLKKEVDALFYVGSAPAEELKVLSQLAGSKKLFRMIPITNKALAESYNFTNIYGSTYKWVDYQIETFAARSVLVTVVSPKEEDKHLPQLEKILNEIRSSMKVLETEGHSNWRVVNFVFDSMNWPTHQAAKNVFKLKGEKKADKADKGKKKKTTKKPTVKPAATTPAATTPK